MTWTKKSDDFTDDCWGLSDAAYRAHSEGLIWSNRKLLDLKIPQADLPRALKHPEAVDELIEKGFWTREGDVFIIRHHGRYQRTREEVVAQQDRNSANAKRRRKPTPVTREQFEPTTQAAPSIPNAGGAGRLPLRDEHTEGRGVDEKRQSAPTSPQEFRNPEGRDLRERAAASWRPYEGDFSVRRGA